MVFPVHSPKVPLMGTMHLIIAKCYGVKISQEKRR